MGASLFNQTFHHSVKPNLCDVIDEQPFGNMGPTLHPVQKDLVLKLHHLLEQEAEALKRLLGAKAGAIGKYAEGSDPNATVATLARLKSDVASRRLHEEGVSTSEVYGPVVPPSICALAVFRLYCRTIYSIGTQKHNSRVDCQKLGKTEVVVMIASLAQKI